MLVTTLLSAMSTLSRAAPTTTTVDSTELGQGPYHYDFGWTKPFISSCSNKTVDVKFRWSIKGLQYTTSSTFMSPTEEQEQKPSIESTYFSFNLTNPAIGGLARCNTTMSGPIPNATHVFWCDKWLSVDAGTVGLYGTRGPRLHLRFHEKTLLLNDGWKCDEPGQRSNGDIQYSARGLIELEYSQCTGASSVTGDWKPGQIYSQKTIGCRADQIDLKPNYLLGVYSADPFFLVIGEW
ncbi:uncharacterized protein QC763_207455 [Podospora pseudopauciseta]|uniref:AA1-like domain-containing protein n=2 Tax=Podospora TaxID=5144 RepID=A0ABR0HQD3_9PEZI|nr:hypothetical protein QC763_207455 [Podospora pseudopauciseta]KAK4679820.1 hypothetical protein QC764_207455 [Podospora pseudoanserina]